MQNVRLGRTGLTVSRIGLGGVQFAKITSEEAERAIRCGLEGGITLLETARTYWDSEEKIGRAIKGRRDGLVIATKSPSRDAEGILTHIDESRKALRTDHIDLYQCHGVDTREDLETIVARGGALEGLLEARDKGRISAIGFTSHNLELCIEMMRGGRFDSAQIPISFINTENHDAGVFDLALELDIGLLAMKPFGGGRLGNARLCMGYVLSVRGVVPVIGVETEEQVGELVSLADDPPVMQEDDEREMKRIREEVGTRFCRACNYCQPCPEGIPIYQVLWLPVYLKQMTSERVLTAANESNMEKAAGCVECGECEDRCPFGIDIIEGLRESREMFTRLKNTGGTGA